MNKKVFQTILTLLSFFILEYLITGSVGSLSPLLVSIYGLSLVKHKDNLGLKVVLWLLIALVPMVVMLPYFVRMFI